MTETTAGLESVAAPVVPPLRRDVRLLGYLAANAISRVGDVAWFVGLAWTATQVAGAAGAGLVMGVSAVPRAAILLLGGALADRLNARRTMIVTDVARMLVLVASIVLVETRSATVPLLLGIAIVFGFADGLYDPAAGTMPRQLVRAEDLGPVASLSQLFSRLATLVGAPLGGVLVATGGLSTVMAFDAASFLVIAIMLVGVVRPRFPLPRSGGRSVRADLVDGFAYLRTEAAARSLTIALCGLNVFVGPITAVGVALRTREESWGAASLGLFEACIGAGAAVGAIVAIRWRPARPARTGLLILVGQAAACAAVGFAPYAGVVAAMLTIGVTAGLASAFLSGAFQRTIAPGYLGRVGSMAMLSDQALMPFAMTGFGVLAGATSLLAACVVTGAGFAALVVWSASRPGIDAAAVALEAPTAS